MKRLNLKSFVKYLSMAVFGIVLAIVLISVPKTIVLASSENDTEYYSLTYMGDGTIDLTITGQVICNEEGEFLLKNNVDKSNIKHIYTSSDAKLTNAKNLFKGFTNLEAVSFKNGIDSSSVTNMSHMFYGCENLARVNFYNFNASNVTDMSYLFYDCKNLVEVHFNNFNTEKVINMAGMFLNCSSLTELDLSSFNVSNIKDTGSATQGTDNMNSMFYGCTKLEKIIVDKDKWVLDSTVRGTDMFALDFSLVGGNGTKYNSSNVHGTYARIDLGGYGIEEPAGYLTDVDNIDLYGKVTTKEGMLNFEIRILPRSGKTYTFKLDNVVITDKTYISDDGYRCYVIQSPAKNMVDTYKFTIVEDGVILCNREVSIASYLTKLYNTTDGSTSEGLKIKNMAGVLLRYGAAAQQRIGYKADSADTLANAGVPDYQNQDDPAICSFGTDITGHCELTPSDKFKTMLDGYNLQYYGINVSMDDNLTFMMAFRLINDSTASEWNDAKKTTFRNAMSEYYNETNETQLPPIDDFKIDDSGKFLIIYTRNVGIKYANKTLYKASALGENVSIPVYLYRNVKYKPDYASVSRCLYSLILTASNY